MSNYASLIHSLHPSHGVLPIALLMGVCSVAMVCAAIIDQRKGILPNVITLPLIVVALVAAPSLFVDPVAHLVWGLVMSITFFGLANVKIRGQYGFGMGDAKLYASISLLLARAVFPVMMLASLIGLAHAMYVLRGQSVQEMKDKKMRHGPHIVMAFVVVAITCVLAAG